MNCATKYQIVVLLLYVFGACVTNAGFINTFGAQFNDQILPRNDDLSFSLELNFDFWLFNQRYTFLRLSTNGFVFLNNTNTRISVYELDLITNTTGNIFHRSVRDAATLTAITNQINKANFGLGFLTTNAYMITWQNVPLFGRSSALHTFQLILATNRTHSYVLCNYLRTDVTPIRTSIEDAFDSSNNIIFTGRSSTTNMNDAGSFVFNAYRILYPFSASFDSRLPPNNDLCYQFNLGFTFRYFSRSYTFLTVCTNGSVGFDRTRSIVYPFERDLILLGTANSGNVLFRSTSFAPVLNSLNDAINRAFPNLSQYRSTIAATITWDRVPDVTSTSRRNTFQVVLVRDAIGLRNYMIINYGRCDSTPLSTRFVDAFNSANSRSFNGNVFNSNVQVPGRFIFSVDGPTILNPTTTTTKTSTRNPTTTEFSSTRTTTTQAPCKFNLCFASFKIKIKACLNCNHF